MAQVANHSVWETISSARYDKKCSYMSGWFKSCTRSESPLLLLARPDTSLCAGLLEVLPVRILLSWSTRTRLRLQELVQCWCWVPGWWRILATMHRITRDWSPRTGLQWIHVGSWLAGYRCSSTADHRVTLTWRVLIRVWVARVVCLNVIGLWVLWVMMANPTVSMLWVTIRRLLGTFIRCSLFKTGSGFGKAIAWRGELVCFVDTIMSPVIVTANLLGRRAIGAVGLNLGPSSLRVNPIWVGHWSVYILTIRAIPRHFRFSLSAGHVVLSNLSQLHNVFSFILRKQHVQRRSKGRTTQNLTRRSL